MGKGGCVCAWVPACAGMTEEGAGMAGWRVGDVVWVVAGGIGGGAGCGGCSVPLTPHLASPLKGGRDELGKGGACPAFGLRLGGGCGVVVLSERDFARVPACAGMTDRRGFLPAQE